MGSTGSRRRLRRRVRENVAGETSPPFNRASSIPDTENYGQAKRFKDVIARVEMKDVELPEAMPQVMAMQAEPIREKRTRIIKAEAEFEASTKLAAASEQMAGNPAARELRRMQRLSEIGSEDNSTTVLMIPSDFVTLAKSLSEYLREHQADERARASIEKSSAAKTQIRNREQASPPHG